MPIPNMISSFALSGILVSKGQGYLCSIDLDTSA